MDPMAPPSPPPAAPPAAPPPPPSPAPPAPPASRATMEWKAALDKDLQLSPTIQKFVDGQDGIVDLVKSYHNLEKLLGHDKIPVPKDEKDVEALRLFRRGLQIPESADGYQLPNVPIPDGIGATPEEIAEFKKEITTFAHVNNLTPKQTAALYQQRMQEMNQEFQQEQQQFQEQMTNTVNTLRQKWGDAYEANIQLGQLVINKFGIDAEGVDFLTEQLGADPRGVEFLAKIGAQFSENQIGEFSAQRFAVAPDQASGEIDKILANPEHPYLNPNATKDEHQVAVDYVNGLYAIAARAKQPGR